MSDRGRFDVFVEALVTNKRDEIGRHHTNDKSSLRGNRKKNCGVRKGSDDEKVRLNWFKVCASCQRKKLESEGIALAVSILAIKKMESLS
jgi:hypothetical protein